MPCCWAPGCRSGYHGVSNEARHFFKAPVDSDRRKLWNRKIPRDGVLTTKSYLCDLHFDERFIIKTFDFNISGQKVSMPRDKWALSDDAVPTIFPNLAAYLSAPPPRKRRVLHRISNQAIRVIPSAAATADSVTCTDTGTSVQPDSMLADVDADNEMATVDESLGTVSSTEPAMKKPLPGARHVPHRCANCAKSSAKLYMRNRQKRILRGQLNRLKQEVQSLQQQLEDTRRRLAKYNHLPAKLQLAVSQTNNGTNSKGNRYSKDWILDCLLIKCKSASAYKMLRKLEFLPLPSVATLTRCIRNMRPEFGFDSTLCIGLAEKLKSMGSMEKRGMLLFDEIQLSKHVDFRSDLGRTVGMVDFGLHTDAGSMHKEGDHALVFMFRPHLSGWMQTIGCFCSAGTTPSGVLAKLILEAILLLEKCGAQVDGIVCDGASTNRKALASFGFCGKIDSVCNKMVNPYDENRNVFFICDAPHLIKTIRNNLLSSTIFMTNLGMVKLEHYSLVVQVDSNPQSGLHAVPKVTEKHVKPNNFQKMSVGIAAQLFSNSVACAMSLYKPHVLGLQDCDATIQFTKKMNDIFDLLNIRRPVDAIRLNSQRNKIQELADAELWLDEWESYVMNLPVDQQRYFLSKQTAQGLRVTLRSSRELASQLLRDGFAYVLTGKFNQDPLEMFFGCVRQSSGADDHPSPNQFLYIYRLMSVKSLIKSPTRASVQTDPSKILVSMQSVPVQSMSLVKTIESALKPLLERYRLANVTQADISDLVFAYCNSDADGLDDLVFGSSTGASDTGNLLMDCDEGEEFKCKDDSEKLLMTCEDEDREPELCILYYLQGYIAHKLMKITNCDLCLESLVENNEDSHGLRPSEARLVLLKSHGGLKFPSKSLKCLLCMLENCVMKHCDISSNMYELIVNEVLGCSDLVPLAVGCHAHSCSLTARCIKLYITSRVHFLNRSVNMRRLSRQEKKKHGKLAKLT